MYVCLSVCLSVCLNVCMYIYISYHLSVGLETGSRNVLRPPWHTSASVRIRQHTSEYVAGTYSGRPGAAGVNNCTFVLVKPGVECVKAWCCRSRPGVAGVNNCTFVLVKQAK